MDAVVYRIWALRRALVATVIPPVLIYAISAWTLGAGAPGPWMIVAGVAYAAITAMTAIAAPALVLLLLPFAVAACAFAGASPWIDAGGSLGLGLSRSTSLTIICLLSGAVAVGVGFIRLKGPLEMIATQRIAAAPDHVFEQMRAENSLACPAHGVSLTRDGEKITVDYGAGATMEVIERVDRRNGIIVMEAQSEDVPGMTSIALYTVRGDGQGGSELEILERAWNAPVGVMAAYALSGILEDYGRSHRDRIEGRPAVSIRDLMMRQAPPA